VTDFQTVVGGGEVVEFTLSETTDVAGLTLKAANQEGLLPNEILVVGIERDGTHITPNDDTRIKPGDLVSVFSPETLPEQLVNAFDSEPRPANEQM
jgi:Trk K+ transport system NAD-binding subunit